jgi:nucleotide-binding universal stress UspA family protein
MLEMNLQCRRSTEKRSVMVASTRIVVGVDGSAGSLDAVRWATREAVRRHVQIEVVTSTLDRTGSYGDAVGLRMGAFRDADVEAKRVLVDAVDVVHDTAGVAGVSVDTRLERGSAAEVLLGLKDRPAMIVVGSRGLGDFTGGLIGSVSSAVVTHARCPVAVIKDGAVRDGPVVVGVDNTPNSRPAIGLALEEASARGVDLLAVHAWSDLELASMFTVDEYGRWWESELAENVSLAESLAGWTDEYPDVTIRRVLVQDRPVRELVRQAEGAQLVVMGSRGRGGFASMLLGSTSRAVLHSVDAPVIIVPTSR